MLFSVTRHSLLAANIAPLVWWQCHIYCWRFESVFKLSLRR